VVLVEGSVKVYYKDHEKEAVKLLPGEKAMVHESEKTIIVHLNENPNFMAWKTKLMIFRDEPLDKVIETINHVYGANLVLANEELGSCRLSATFDKQALPSVLQVIASTLALDIQSTPEQTILSGAPCNR
jgi:ferric-dicitrate binding protein FerR (iron transport regulator)